MKELIANGAKIDLQDEHQMSALPFASQIGHIDMVDLLLFACIYDVIEILDTLF